MASLVLKMSISLDGYIAPADGSSGWEATGRSPDGAEWVSDTLSNARAHLVGAATYTRWADFWPRQSGPIAAAMNEIPKVVFSKTLEHADWAESRIMAGDLGEDVARLKAEDGAYLLAHGGAAFAQALSRARLIDEYRLVIEPAALGDGLPMFRDLGGRLALELVDARTYSTGTAVHVYRPRT